MAWLQVQAASRRPGGGDADVLNRLRLGRAKAATATQNPGVLPGEAGTAAPSGTQRTRHASAGDGSQRSAKTSSKTAGATSKDLPSWVSVGATLMYRSRSCKGGRLKVTVTQVEEDKVTFVFKHDASAWKRIPCSQVLARDGPLRPLTSQELARAESVEVQAVQLSDDGGRSRSRSPVRAASVSSAGEDDAVEILSADECVEL
mmetsp:Transcript_12020/g.35140  ORF Transcript_12020/g.35140 Transcript_12020/m.35140 type:complete len:203 (+) Transcript_12020:2-610(+)